MSVVVPTRDEESALPGCLASVAWAAERIIVDCGSTDRTREIAVALGARVLERDFTTWGEQRNHAADHAENDWILCLDADERVSPELARELARELADPHHEGYRIPRRGYVMGRWIRHCGWQRDRVLRLYRRSRARWDLRLVHERVLLEQPVGDLVGHLDHFTARDLGHFLDKSRRYGLLGGEELFRQGRRSGPVKLLLLPLVRFLKMYVVQRGFLDGVPGLVVAAAGAHGVFVKYARLWELQREASTSPHLQRR